MTAGIPAAFERDLRDAAPGDLYFDPIHRGLYATDASHYQIMPAAVVVPRSEEDVIRAIAAAARHGVSILPRGGGTSLAGTTVGPGLVIDFSKHLNRILEVNPAERWARVQPGLVRDELNAALAPHRLHFAPDPATGNRANIGGMIGTNASGTRSIRYGKTSENVLGVRLLLSNGTTLELQEWPPEEYRRRAAGAGREGAILRRFEELIRENADDIQRRYPTVMRRVMGYALDAFAGRDRWNLARLVTGSEGTLGVVLEARLKLTPAPTFTALCLAHFDELPAALRAVTPILEHQPSAVELLDHHILAAAGDTLGVGADGGLLHGAPRALLIIEVMGDSAGEARERAERLVEFLKRQGLGYAHPILSDPAPQARVWEMRKSGLGVTEGMKGDRKPLAFIDDAAVPIERLPEYIDQVLAICRTHQADAVVYAHASVGVLHVKPILDLRRPDDIARMRAIAEACFERAVACGGVWSGEHGDGLVRSEFMERYFGTRLYQVFQEVKALFDPAGLMNPGKIVGAPRLDENLRFGPRYRTPDAPTHFHYRDHGGFGAAVHMCTGVGACRKTLGGTMCPSYMATREEEHSTRGRANALRLAMSGQLGPDAMTSHALHAVLDLCLSCKACKAECPSNVDMARLKSEFLQGYHDRHGVSFRDRLTARLPGHAARWAGPLAPLLNALAGLRPVRKAMGFAADRPLPALARDPFPAWFDRRPAGAGAKRVVLFDDTFLNYFEPAMGRAAVELLESCGYAVTRARAGCCQRTRISKGFLREARRDGERTLRALDAWIRQGLDIVVCEPSCVSALTDDLPDLIDDEELGRRIRRHVRPLEVFLADALDAGAIPSRFTSPARQVLLHGHCHQKAQFGTAPIRRLLARAPGLEVRELDAGCCGMAGGFGYEAEHAALSRRIGEQRLLPALRNLDPDTAVIAGGFSCRHQIRIETGLRARHWAEMIRADGRSAGMPPHPLASTAP
jgi:FAD/FMN-containing dehydrogenase/Fe-S oxidoreductase